MKVNFGKLFFMAVSFNSLLLSFPALSDDNSINQQALDYADKQLIQAISKADKKISICIKKRPVNAEEVRPQLPAIDNKKLQYALAYLASRHTDKCMKEVQKNVLYALSSLERLVVRFEVNDKYEKTISKTKGTYGGTFPDVATFRIRYYQLSENVRNKLESIPQLQDTYFDALTLHEELTN